MAFPSAFAVPLSVIRAAYLVGYVLLDWISFIEPFAPFGITPWNPPTGLSFIVVLLFGQRFIPLLFVAPLLADLFVRHLPFPWTVEIAAVSIVGAGYAIGLSFLVRSKTRFNPALASIRDLVVLLAVAGASALLVAVSYVALLVVTGFVPPADFAHAAVKFWVGDVIGVAVIAPFALILLIRGSLPRLSLEFGLQVAAIFLALLLVFFYEQTNHFQLFYVVFLPIIWMAVRGGLDTVTILVTQIGLMMGVQLLPQFDVDVTNFQAPMLVLTLTGLVAGALVTEHRCTEMQLRLHQDSLARIARLGSVGELAASVAHQINQPLMAAGTYTRLVAETLRLEPGNNARVAETADKAAAQVGRAAEVLRRLRALVRLDQSGRAPASVERILRETLELSRPSLDRHRVAAVTRLDPALPPVMVDILQIEQVLLNLVRNSIEAIAETGAAAERSPSP